MKKRKRPPFSIYPKPTDLADATTVADAEDLHLSQVFLRAFRIYIKRRKAREDRKAGRRRPAMSSR